MDVVYVVGPGEPNDELRYSLRSLRNLPHDTVWIAGFIPSWVTGVGRIPVEQNSGKYRNSRENLKAACLHPEVSEEFVYFNDDFFVIRPIEEVPVAQRGPLADLLKPTHRRKPKAESYGGGRADTYRLLTELGFSAPVAYEPLHVPMRFRKTLMLEALRVGENVPALHYRTLYGNLHAIGGERYPNVKLSDRKALPREEWAFVSTNERTFERGKVGQMLRKRFPDPSPYEVT